MYNIICIHVKMRLWAVFAGGMLGIPACLWTLGTKQSVKVRETEKDAQVHCCGHT